MPRVTTIALLLSFALPANAGVGRVGRRVALVQSKARPLRIRHGSQQPLGTLPFFGQALLVAVQSAQKTPRAHVLGLLLPARLAPENTPRLEARRSSKVVPIAPDVAPIVRAALWASGFRGEVEIQGHGGHPPRR